MKKSETASIANISSTLGAVAVISGASDQSHSVSDISSKNIPQDLFQEAINSIQKIVGSAIDAEKRMAAFSALQSMLVAAQARIAVANRFVGSMSRIGIEINENQFLQGNVLQVGTFEMHNESVKLPSKDAISLINKCREHLMVLFSGYGGKKVAEGTRQVDQLMRNIEERCSKSSSEAVTMAFREFALNNEAFAQKLRSFVIGNGVTPVKSRTMDRVNSPELRM